MLVDLLEYSAEFLRKAGIPVIFLKEPYNSRLPDLSPGLPGAVLEIIDYQALAQKLQTVLTPGKLVYLKTSCYLNFAIFSFADKLRAEYQKDSCIIGPFLFQPLTVAEFGRILEIYGLSSEMYQDVQEFYNQVRVIASAQMWFHMISQVVDTLLEKPAEVVHIEMSLSDFLSFPESAYEIPSNTDIAANIVELRYQAEEAFLKALLAGDDNALIPLYQTYRQYRLMPRSPDPLRNYKMQLTVLNTLMRKTVQEACVHPLHIDNFSTQMAVQIENGEDLRQLKLLELTMVRKYCMLVKKYSRLGHSPVVQACMDYIDFHYIDKLTLAGMAERSFVTKNYLSGLFKKETGMTITEYIQNTRIQQSLILLRTTTLSVLEIGEQCGYADADYFTRIFKRTQGMTPREYRKKIHSEQFEV